MPLFLRAETGSIGMERPDLLLDLHRGQDRLGPGGEAETLLAISLSGLAPTGDLRVADLGCGTGASALTIARALSARVVAVDLFPEFLVELRRRAASAGLLDQIETRVASMDAPAFEDGSLDAIWSEGAIYNIGFAEGIRSWRRYLKPGGILAVTDLTWWTVDRPAALTAYWERLYPGVGVASAKMALLEASGYSPIGYFPLPMNCWLENYYRPLRSGFDEFIARHRGSAEARAIIDAENEEFSIYQRYSSFFGYGFYIARRVGE
jgi:SAM-dependent methyltransferase